MINQSIFHNRKLTNMNKVFRSVETDEEVILLILKNYEHEIY